jgi:hypothetical protein
VVLDAPDRLEAQRLGELGQSQLVLVDLAIAALLLGVLEHRRQANVHRRLPLF